MMSNRTRSSDSLALEWYGLDGQALGDRPVVADDHLVVGFEAPDDLHFAAVVEADLDRRAMDLAVAHGVHRAMAFTVLLDQRGRGDGQVIRGAGELEGRGAV